MSLVAAGSCVADQMCDQHYLSQERTQEAATKTGAAVTSGGTEGLLPLCVSGQKTRTMFNEKEKASTPPGHRKRRRKWGLPGRRGCFCFSGPAGRHCPTPVPRCSILEKLKSQIIKPFTPAEEWKVAASVVSRKRVGTAGRERAGHSHCQGNTPPCLPPDGQARVHGRGNLRKKPSAEASKHVARGFQRERATTGGNSIQVKFNTNTCTHFCSSRSPNRQQVGTTQTLIDR